MQKYAKLIDGKIEFAPKNKGSISNYNLSVELMTADGYKPFVVVEEPTPEKPIIHYLDTKERIEQYAEAKPIEQKAAEARDVRNQYLEQTDKYMITDYPITDDERELYRQYRTYLRTYPECRDWYKASPKIYEEWKQGSDLEQIVASGD